MGGIIVVKVGSGGVDTEHVAADVAALRSAGRQVIVVHGGADDIDGLAARLGVAQRRLEAPDGVTSRYTDEATLEVVVLALAGAAKPRLLAALARHGVAALGLTGLDARLLRAERKRAHRTVVGGRTIVVRDDRSGRLTAVDHPLLRRLLAADLVPVVSPPALDEEGEPVNVDADRVAAAVAVAVRAAALVFLTAAPGVLADPADEQTRIAHLALPASGRHVVGTGGGMGLKLVAAREALAGGVPVTIADGRVAGPLRRALAGRGTRVSLAATTSPGKEAPSWA